MASVDVTREYQGLSVTEFEQRVRSSSEELGAIVDDIDGVIRARAGALHEIEWDEEDCELIPGRILTHNHPLGDSFSPSDVRLAWEFGAAQLRAVAPDGTTYLLEAAERGWGAYRWEEIVEVAQAWAETVFAEIEVGLLTTSTPMDVIWYEVAQRLDLTYSRSQQ